MPHNLLQALEYLQRILEQRLKQHFEPGDKDWEIPPFQLAEEDGTPFTQFLQQTQLSSEELLVLLLALVPHIYPSFLDGIVGKYLPKGGDFPAFGGVKGKNHRGTLPTGETALFLLGGNDLILRFQGQQILSTQHFFRKENVLYLETLKSNEPRLSGQLILDEDYVDLFTTGMITIPKLSTSFPAQYLSTQMTWDDVVLHPTTLQQIDDLETWLKHQQALMYDWGMHRKLKPGYRALFHGPPGTGKTLIATLLGQNTKRPVFRVDLSSIVSKYIGETEKNLSKLFDKAQNKDWILFFDEADALFGKRTNVRDAHDKYANQEVSYLLQRIEAYPGLVILASNFKSNIDDAFLRRFNAIVYFPIPGPKERLQLWQKSFPPNVQFDASVNLEAIAQQYELTGSHIMNIVQYVCLQALRKNTNMILTQDIQQGIEREFAKQGKRISHIK